jgi:hypothetical protein
MQFVHFRRLIKYEMRGSMPTGLYTGCWWYYSHLATSQSRHACISQNQSYIATDCRSISKSWCRAPYGVHDQIFIIVRQLRSCFCGTPSLTRGRVCFLYMLLALDSAVFLESESLGSRDHILLSQFWDFPFSRLLRLAGSRWRYSTPPPQVKVKVKVTVRLTVSQSVSLGDEPKLGLMTRYLLHFDFYGLVFLGRPLWREGGFVFCICCWPSPA